MCLKQKRQQQPPELKRSKSQGIRKLQKAQSVASVEEMTGGGAHHCYYNLCLFML